MGPNDFLLKSETECNLCVSFNRMSVLVVSLSPQENYKSIQIVLHAKRCT